MSEPTNAPTPPPLPPRVPELPAEPSVSQEPEPALQTVSHTPPQPTAVPQEQWVDAFQKTHGREPSLSEYQAAVTAGEIAKFANPSVQQMSQGARQIASGMRGIFDSKVAPAAKKAAASAQDLTRRASSSLHSTSADGPHDNDQSPSESATNSATKAPGTLVNTWSSKIIPLAAIAGIFSVFLPFVSVMGIPMSLAESPSYEEAEALIIAFAVVIIISTVALFVRRRWMRITTAVIAILVGVLTSLDGFQLLINITNESYASIGIGLLLLCIVGITLIVAPVKTLLDMRAQRSQRARP